ncbi:FAD-dependent oxidoreductase [Streptomyces chilikensis]|uniref:FAD-dependent oxidoreductase n=1 Tax=Streptomyces chilikensis TaxID=1194079 RepID=A0ABV3EUT8_9ACTN
MSTRYPPIGPSYWMRTAPGDEPYPSLASDVDVDVAVIGAGMAGLSTAHELMRAGRTVAVLEAGRLAGGVTGYTTAKLTALHGMVYARLRRTRGAEGARLYARSQTEAIEHAAALVEELGVDCDWEPRSAYSYVTDPARADQVRAEAEAAREAGLPAVFTQVTGLPFPVAGAVRLDGQAQFHPRSYLLAIAADLAAQGALILENTRVTGLTEGDPHTLEAETGHVVRARDVVVATHYPVFDRALLFSRLKPRREFVVAGRMPDSLDPDGMYITSEENTRSVRTAPLDAPGKRLLIVTGEHVLPGTGDPEERFRRLADWAVASFPGTEPAYGWATQDTDATDTVPLVGPLHPGARGLWVATGFRGWGMSGGIMAGRLLATLIDGKSSPWAELYDPRRVLPVLREAPRFLQTQAEVAKHFVGDRLAAACRTMPVDGIEPGDGAVVRVGGETLAVHRDEEGALHAVSARCTHLGCLVGFNAAERAWECPCHGSRFAPDGSVLQGPATRPLARRELRRRGDGPPAS